jgi:hypothetical protein
MVIDNKVTNLSMHAATFSWRTRRDALEATLKRKFWPPELAACIVLRQRSGWCICNTCWCVFLILFLFIKVFKWPHLNSLITKKKRKKKKPTTKLNKNLLTVRLFDIKEAKIFLPWNKK